MCLQRKLHFFIYTVRRRDESREKFFLKSYQGKVCKDGIRAGKKNLENKVECKAFIRRSKVGHNPQF